MIDDTPTAMVAYGIQGMDEGERLMREGRIMAIVQIPAFFEKNILSNSQTLLENYVSGTNITVNGLLSKDIQTAVTTFTAGIQLQVLMKQGLTQRQAMAQLMPVRFDKHVLFNPHINYGYYLSPSFMPMMLMIFGYYYAIINTIKTFLDNLRAFDLAGMKDGILLLAPFGIGVALGIFLIAKLITFLFEKYGVQTFCAILGLVISSPIAIFINTGLVSKLGSLSLWEILFGIVLMAAGAFVTVFVGER